MAPEVFPLSVLVRLILGVPFISPYIEIEIEHEIERASPNETVPVCISLLFTAPLSCCFFFPGIHIILLVSDKKATAESGTLELSLWNLSCRTAGSPAILRLCGDENAGKGVDRVTLND